jgi:hypothetical protein
VADAAAIQVGGLQHVRDAHPLPEGDLNTRQAGVREDERHGGGTKDDGVAASPHTAPCEALEPTAPRSNDVAAPDEEQVDVRRPRR